MCDTQIEEWLRHKAEVLPFVTVGPFKIGELAELRQSRKNTQTRVEAFYNKLLKLRGTVIEKLTAASKTAVPQVETICFDQPSQNLRLRWVAFAIRQMQVTVNLLRSKQFNYIEEKLSNVGQVRELLTNLPHKLKIDVDDEFFHNKADEIVEAEYKSINYLKVFVKRTQEEISTYTKPSWVNSLEEFLDDLVTSLKTRVDPEISYFRPIDAEVSLSRALFNHRSPYRAKLDSIISQYSTMTSQDFVTSLVDTAQLIIPHQYSEKPFEQSIALLSIFRVLFNRFYELYPEYLLHPIDECMNVVWVLRKLPAKAFPLPSDLITGDIEGKSISEVFNRDNQYHAAAQFLENAIFETNPTDVLYYLHRCLLSINKGALINRLGANPASPEDVNQLLCFDDLFSLFFGVFLASEVPDIFGINRFLNDYAPKQNLSPAFEYTQANLEALVMHCRGDEVRKIIERCKCL